MIIRIGEGVCAIYSEQAGEYRSIDTGPAGNSIAICLANGLIPRRSNIILLCDSVFHQIVRLPKIQTKGLAPSELLSALKFEIEPFSPLGNGQGIYSYAEIPEHDPSRTAWDVLQVDKIELESYAVEIGKAGCSLYGLTSTPVSLLNADNNRSAFSDFIKLINNGANGIPIIKPEKENTFTRSPICIGIFSAAVLTVISFLDYKSLSSRVNVLRPLASESSMLAAENDGIKSKISEFERKTSAIAARRLQRIRAVSNLEAAQGAIAVLLKSLPAACGESIVISSIDPGDSFFSLNVKCLATSPERAANALVSLSSELTGKGWTVTPGEISNNTESGVSVFEFNTMFNTSAETATASMEVE